MGEEEDKNGEEEEERGQRKTCEEDEIYYVYGRPIVKCKRGSMRGLMEQVVHQKEEEEAGQKKKEDEDDGE